MVANLVMIRLESESKEERGGGGDEATHYDSYRHLEKKKKKEFGCWDKENIIFVILKN